MNILPKHNTNSKKNSQKLVISHIFQLHSVTSQCLHVVSHISTVQGKQV